MTNFTRRYGALAQATPLTGQTPLIRTRGLLTMAVSSSAQLYSDLGTGIVMESITFTVRIGQISQ
jgi:hypothetical protein